MFILFYYLPKNLINDFQLKISSTYQYIAKFRSHCAKTKKKHLCPEVQPWNLALMLRAHQRAR